MSLESQSSCNDHNIGSWVRGIVIGVLLVVPTLGFSNPGDTTGVSVGLTKYGPHGDSAKCRVTPDGRYVAFSSSAPDILFGDWNQATDVFVYDCITNSTVRASTGPNGAEAAEGGDMGDISPDGRYVTFTSSSQLTGSNSGTNYQKVYLKDLLTGSVTLLTPTYDGLPHTGHSNGGTFSGNGRYVSITSKSKLLPSATTGISEAYVKDLLTGLLYLVSVSHDGSARDGDTTAGPMSSDGRYVLMTSSSTNLIPGDTNGKSDVFLRDIVNGTTIRVSVSNSENEGDNNSSTPFISHDGRYVAFSSLASNLVSGDNNNYADAFVRDIVAGTTVRATLSHSGAQSSRGGTLTGLSADGNRVYFISEETLVPNDVNGMNLFERSLALQSTVLLDRGPNGEEPNGFAPQFGIGSVSAYSNDGNLVVFPNSASNFGFEDLNGYRDIYLKQLQTSQFTKVSKAMVSSLGDDSTSDFSVSGDGRYVAFSSFARNIMSTSSYRQIYLRDMQLGTTSVVSEQIAGTWGNGASTYPYLSADSRYLAFSSVATNLVPISVNGKYQLFVRDLVADANDILSVNSLGELANADCKPYGISNDGQKAVFLSTSTNLVANDTNGKADIFVRSRVTGSTERVSNAFNGAEANDQAQSACISGNGQFVAFVTLASNVLPGDNNNSPDVFVRNLATGELFSPTVGSPTGGTIGGPSLSDDGRFLVYQVSSWYVYVCDLSTGISTQVNLSAGGVPSVLGSLTSSISRDGRVVAMVGYFDNGFPMSNATLVLRDWMRGITTLASKGMNGAVNNNSCSKPVMNTDGSFVVYSSKATNLAPEPFVGVVGLITNAFRSEADFSGKIISGNLILQDYDFAGDGGAPPNAVAQVYKNGILKETWSVAINSDGRYAFATAQTGSINVKWQFYTGLRRSVVINVGGTDLSGINVDLINGDSDGSNGIDLGDFDNLVSSFGNSHPSSPMTDFNNDNVVDLGDFDILAASFGQEGD